MGGISVPSVNNPVFSYAALAAGCFRHSQTPPPPTQAKAAAKGTPEREEEVPPQRGPLPNP